MPGCPNKRLSELTRNGPWHLLHCIPDMGALILLFVAAAEGGPVHTAGTVAGDRPPAVVVAPKGKPDPMLVACQAAGAAAAASDAEAAAVQPYEIGYTRQVVAGAIAAEDWFTLRWFTFAVMFTSDAVVNQLSCGAPAPVVERFMRPFKLTMANHLFGKCHRVKKNTQLKHEHVISTPLELVAMLMIQLKASYFVPTN
jgi:hypothetical protein